MTQTTQTSPPRLDRPRPRVWWIPAWSFLALVLAAAALPSLLDWHFPLLQCHWRKWTGIPCPGCGSTRALLALSHFQVEKALRLNPLAFVAYLGICGWFLLWLADRCLNYNWTERLQQLRLSRFAWLLLGLALLVNWIYLLFTLPRGH